MTTKEALIAARDLLENVTPLPTDCGQLCSAACCRDSQDEEEVAGMLLFPGEAELYAHQGAWMELLPSAVLFDGEPVELLTCFLPCPRKHRPLACRIFPLRIRLETEGEETRAKAEIDPRAWCVCPLLEQGGMRAMSQDFVAAVERAGNILAGNVYMLEALLNEQRMIDEMRKL